MFNPVKSVQTVSQFTASLKGLIETSHPFVNIQGEVSNLRIPYSGHMYFILKDDKAQIRAVLFKGQRRYLPKDFKDGDKLICRGRITVYEPRGDYQIIVDAVEMDGHGRMHLEYAALKEKLDRAGLFAPENKKELPPFASKICLITSPSGAAVHDFLKIGLRKHPDLQVEIIPTAMQGNQAPLQIRESLERACRRNWADIIVLCRGGGSIEDLWAFNDELLARAIARAPLPVVSAIGHEVDFTIADFVADLRAPTPTAAAEMLVPDIPLIRATVLSRRETLHKEITGLLRDAQTQLQHQLKFLGDPRLVLDQQQLKMDHLLSQLELAFSRDIPRKKENLSRLTTRLLDVSPEKTLSLKQQVFTATRTRLLAAQEGVIQRGTEQLQRNALMLDTLSPLAVLARGYSITTNTRTKNLVSAVTEVQLEDILAIQLQGGIVKAKTTDIIPT